MKGNAAVRSQRVGLYCKTSLSNTKRRRQGFYQKAAANRTASLPTSSISNPQTRTGASSCVLCCCSTSLQLATSNLINRTDASEQQLCYSACRAAKPGSPAACAGPQEPGSAQQRTEQMQTQWNLIHFSISSTDVCSSL